MFTWLKVGEYTKKALKISKRKSEDINWKKTDNYQPISTCVIKGSTH